MKLRFDFDLRDWRVGFAFDHWGNILYFSPLPTITLTVHFPVTYS
jgi:hypothetical protein